MKNRLLFLLVFVVGTVLGFLLAKPSTVHAQYKSTSVKIKRVEPMNMGPLGGSESVTGSVIGFSCTSDSDGNSECYIASQ
jgi:hypothetical protein